ncbi:hypothetical protein [Piscinibacter defluvii]|uniref:hypothetical protein n=1 Tax=Piscinibacter defluvii TaxID=1796922 RepID=UPI001F0C03F2|nr:hypothetical protein [Piscinibacter defluvii]
MGFKSTTGIDDSLDVFAPHGVSGMVGTWLPLRLIGLVVPHGRRAPWPVTAPTAS